MGFNSKYLVTITQIPLWMKMLKIRFKLPYLIWKDKVSNLLEPRPICYLDFQTRDMDMKHTTGSYHQQTCSVWQEWPTIKLQDSGHLTSMRVCVNAMCHCMSFGKYVTVWHSIQFFTNDIKIPFLVVHLILIILIRRECISCIFWLM